MLKKRSLKTLQSQFHSIQKEARKRLRLVDETLIMESHPKDYLHGRKGPWPQPCPVHPFGESPAVLHLPLSEWIDWWAHIGSRYVVTLGYTPFAYLQGILKPGLEKVSDLEFTEMLEKSMLSKFITPKLDDEDKKNFYKYLNSEDRFFIVDLQSIQVVKTFNGIYASATKTLLRETSPKKFEVVAIYVAKTNSVFTPTDGDGWELSKYFVLQGGAMAATLVVHPLLHFPFDSINAITKTALPKNHVLFKLLYPHLRFTLPLENAVLNFKSSLLSAKAWMSYAPYPGPSAGLRDLLVEGYRGIKGNASYPAFSYPMEPPKIYSNYGTWLEGYHKEIYNFVRNVLKDVKTDDIHVLRWAKYVSEHVPGFPNQREIFQGDNFVKAVTMYFWTITVAHSADHYNYGRMDIRKIPMRIRQQPPYHGIKMENRKKLTKFWDYGKYEMARVLFFKANEVTTLIKTEYDFEDPEFQNYVRQFKERLMRYDKTCVEQGIQFMPLDKIAASIQY